MVVVLLRRMPDRCRGPEPVGRVLRDPDRASLDHERCVHRRRATPTDENVRRFVRDFGTIFDRIRRLDAWRRSRVQRVVDVIGQDDAMALESYLAGARFVLPKSALAYDELLEWWPSA
jgi:hypothetical protein